MALSKNDASIIMGMLNRGDYNQDIAAWFGENPARIVEVQNGDMFGAVAAPPANQLPPKGAVGPKARRLRAYARDALAFLKSNDPSGAEKAIQELEAGLADFEKQQA